MSENAFNVSVRLQDQVKGGSKSNAPVNWLQGRKLTQIEYSRERIHSADTVRYDIQGENNKRFVLVLERGSDIEPAYVIILLDGVVSDHFFVGSGCQLATSQGWRKSMTEVFTYLWAQRNWNRQDEGHFRFITLRFYRIKVSMQDELKAAQNFLEKPTCGRYNKPLMDYYAMISKDAIKAQATLRKKRLPSKIWKLKLPVPFFQVSYRYNDSIRHSVGTLPFSKLLKEQTPAVVGSKRNNRELSDDSTTLKDYPAKKQALPSKTWNLTAPSPSSSNSFPRAGSTQQQAKARCTNQSTTYDIVNGIRGFITATDIMIKDSNKKGEQKNISQLTAERDCYMKALEEVTHIDLTDELLSD